MMIAWEVDTEDAEGNETWVGQYLGHTVELLKFKGGSIGYHWTVDGDINQAGYEYSVNQAQFEAGRLIREMVK